MLIILITFMPVKFALNDSFNADLTLNSLNKIENTLASENKADLVILTQKTKETIDSYKVTMANDSAKTEDKKLATIGVRTAITKLSKKVGNELKNPSFMESKDKMKSIKKELSFLKNDIEYSPRWVTIMIALCLGLGTMIGWKRIAVTIGEKIGKRHMTYAEGATAELTAAATIGLSSGFGLPVSTTHVLSSGVAGAMTASKGVKNLQPDFLS